VFKGALEQGPLFERLRQPAMRRLPFVGRHVDARLAQKQFAPERVKAHLLAPRIERLYGDPAAARLFDQRARPAAPQYLVEQVLVKRLRERHDPQNSISSAGRLEITSATR